MFESTTYAPIAAAPLITYGLDLGLKNGAICELRFGPDLQVEQSTFFPWPFAALKPVSPDDVEAILEAHYLILHDWLLRLPEQDSGRYLCLGDWTPLEVYWRSSSRSAVVKAHLAGFYSGILDPRILVSWVSPRALRQSFGLQGNLPKADFHREVREQLGPEAPDWFDGHNDHEVDAGILALAGARFLQSQSRRAID